jgi:phosphoglycolate phosphatase
MLYRNVIFDLDGTLVDSAQLTGLIIDQMFAERGIDRRADRDLIRQMDAVGGEAMISAVMGPDTDNPAIDLNDFRTRFGAIQIPATLPFNGVTDALHQLRAQGVSFAICSNKPQLLCEKILGDLGLQGLFAVVVGSEPHRPRKPDPISTQIALAALGGTKRDTLYCGDSLIDVATAAAAELDICLVSWGYGTDEAIRTTPNLRILQQIEELLDLCHSN